MIYKNGKQWDGWKADLKKRIGQKDIKRLLSDAKFVPSEKYSGMRVLGNGKTPPSPKKSYAISIGIPVEYPWTDETGERCIIRYVERSEPLQVGDKVEQILQPGSIYIDTRSKNHFSCDKRMDLLWFYLASPYCDNGFYYDDELWGVSKTEAQENIAARIEPPKYYYEDESMKIAAQIEEDDLQIDALYAVKKMSEEDKRRIYASLGGDNFDTMKIGSIDLWLRNRAKTNPKEILDADKEEVSYKAEVKKAIDSGVINYVKNKRVWKFTDQDNPICTVPKSVNPEDYLVKWLRERDDNGEVFEYLKASIKEPVMT